MEMYPGFNLVERMFEHFGELQHMYMSAFISVDTTMRPSFSGRVVEIAITHSLERINVLLIDEYGRMHKVTFLAGSDIAFQNVGEHGCAIVTLARVVILDENKSLVPLLQHS
jgi:hypothetical protein